MRVRAGESLPHGRTRVETADLHLFTDAGVSIFVAEEFRVRHASRAVLERSLRDNAQPAYALTWVPASRETATAATTPTTTQTVAVLGAGQERGRPLCQALEALGHQVRPWLDDTPVDTAVDLVVDARFLDLGTGATDALRAVLTLSASLQALPPQVPVAVLGDGHRSAAPVREALWGMLAALEAEEPQRRLVRVGLDAGWTPAALAGALSAAMDAGFDETRLALDGDGVRVARLVPAPIAAAVPSWEGSVLITGGLGALGLSVTRILARQGAKAITLMGRSGPGATAQRTIDELTASGVSVAVVTGDVTDSAACARAVAAAGALAPLHGVFHLAGATADGAFTHLTPADFELVFAAKARGAETLAAAVHGEPLRAFVLFSSVSSVLGSAGQANYAAANGYLDGLAEALRASGVPATSINWGPWVPSGKGGMAAAAAATKAAERLGVRPLADADAEGLLGLAVSAATPRLVAVAADFTRFADAVAQHPRAALVAGLATRPRREPDTPGGPAQAKGWLHDALDGLETPARDDGLRDAIRALVGDTLGDPAAVNDELGFADMGLDSIMAIDLRTRLAHALGTDLPATVAIDHPTVPAMASFLGGLAFVSGAAVHPADIPRAVGAVLPTATLGAPDLPEPEPLSLDQLIQAVRDDLAVEQ